MGVRAAHGGRVAVALAAWALALLGPAAPGPATAAAEPRVECPGVAVLVVPGELGGEETVACAAADGDRLSAAAAFEAVGAPLEYLPQQPGFVCRVGGLPRRGPCFDGDAYWSLWSSDGVGDGSLEWVYATLGVTALEVPAGGAVAFVWHEGDGRALPPETAVESLRAAAPTPDAGDGADGADSDTRTAGTGDTSVSSDAGLSGWVVALAVLVVLAAASVPILRRRR